MKVSALQSEILGTSLSASATYELSPCDAFFGRHMWLSRLLFFPNQLDWNRLREALVKVERAYPPLCGRYVDDENGSRSIHVDPDGENGFGLVEIDVDSTVEQLRGSRKMASCCRESIGPYMNWPFFLEPEEEDPLLRDEDSLFGVHLIRATDGCILSFSQYHLLSDGGRMVKLMADVGRAYRGLEIETPHLDRSLMWPDQYLSHFPLSGHSPGEYPRRFVGRQRPLGEEASHVAQIQLRQEVIDGMKRMTEGLLEGVDFVSTNDLIVALCWLLRAEVVARQQSVPASGVPIEGTSVHFPVDTLTTCVPAVPPNYYGNALGRAMVTYPADSLPQATLVEKLARAASLIRLSVDDVQKKPQSAVEALVTYHHIGCSEDSVLIKGCISSSASRTKLAFKEIDFGYPQFAYAPLTFPAITTQSGTEPSPDGDGVLLQFVIPKRDRKLLESSAVLAECAPGVVVFPENMEPEHAGALMSRWGEKSSSG